MTIYQLNPLMAFNLELLNQIVWSSQILLHFEECIIPKIDQTLLEANGFPRYPMEFNKDANYKVHTKPSSESLSK